MTVLCCGSDKHGEQLCSSLKRVFRNKSKDVDSPDMLFLRGKRKDDATNVGKKTLQNLRVKCLERSIYKCPVCM